MLPGWSKCCQFRLYVVSLVSVGCSVATLEWLQYYQLRVVAALPVEVVCSVASICWLYVQFKCSFSSRGMLQCCQCRSDALSSERLAEIFFDSIGCSTADLVGRISSLVVV